MRCQIALKKHGFTLAEVLIASVVLTVLLAAFALVFIYSLNIGAATQSRLKTQQDLRATLEYLSRFIRLAGIQPVDVGMEEIEENYLTFQSDVDADSVTDRFQIRYSSADKTVVLERWFKNGTEFQSYGQPEVVMDNVASLVFTYFTADNVETTDPALVSAVRISISLIPTAGDNKSEAKMVGELEGSTLVYCPNLGMRL
ncbi:MAG: prepilin-type N-terminal cleavage/methylation domain-containing protein [bacterium]|jgi:prepilin-type N-terminal cleavage/methylation domain-containing protein